MIDSELIWQTRDEMPYPSNPLQELREILTNTSRDISEDKMIACLYGIIVGWDNESYKQLKEKHGWATENINLQKQWHITYNKIWNSHMDMSRNSVLEAVEKGSIEFLNWVVSRKDITPDHHRKEMWYVVKNEEVFNMPTDHLYKEYKIYLQDQNKK